MSALAVARHLVHLSTRDAVSVGMAPERLHLLLCYCQGWHRAWYGRPLFADPIRADAVGPRVPVIAAQPRGAWDEPITAVDAPELSNRDRKAVEQVWDHFKRYTLDGLRAKARAEAVWASGPAGADVPGEALFRHFGAEYARLTGDRPGAAAATERNLAEGNGKTLDQVRAENGW